MSPAPDALVSCVTQDGVALVTLTNGARRNSITVPMVEQLISIFDAVEADPGVGAVIVTGEGPAFCAGADLSHLGRAASGDADAEKALRSVYAGFERVHRCTKPTLAAVNGPAVGAGMNLALACDIRVAARSATFSTRFLSLGIHPGGGHTWMFHSAVGPAVVNAAVLFGQDIDGPSAERVGLAWRCVDDDALLKTAREIAGRAATAPVAVAVAAKASIRTMATVETYQEAIEVEIVKQLWSATQPEFAERMKALGVDSSRR